MNTSGYGDRYNEGKPKLSFVLEAHSALAGAARVMEYAASHKYSRGNWRKGLKVTEIVDSMTRHLCLLMEGNDFDEESELPIVDHIMCNALFLACMYHDRYEMDDRMQPPLQEAGGKSQIRNDAS